MPFVRLAVPFDAFFFLRPETKTDLFFNPERFTGVRTSLITKGILALNLEPDRLTTVLKNERVWTRAALRIRFDPEKKAAWIDSLYRAEGATAADWEALIDDAAVRAGEAGMFSCAVTLDDRSEPVESFLRAGFIRRRRQSVYVGPAASLPAADVRCYRWIPVSRSVPDSFIRFRSRELKENQAAIFDCGRRKFYGLREGNRVIGCAAAAKGSQSLYLEPCLSVAGPAEAAEALAALAERCGAEERTRIAVCVDETQRLVGGCLKNRFELAAAQGIYVKCLTRSVRHREPRPVESFPNLSVATVQKAESKPIETYEPDF